MFQSAMHTDKFATKPGELKWSIEIKPPSLGKTVDDICTALEQIIEYNPISIEVTYHQEKIVSREENGCHIGYPLRKNPGTISLCSYLVGYYAGKYDVEIIPHLICGGFSVRECEEALIDLNVADIKTVLALRGDPQDEEKGFEPHPEGHKYASGLVEQISNLNNGKYLFPIQEPVPTRFCIGVAGYPEKHYEAPNLDYDIRMLKNKVEKGAHFVVTQMCFDNSRYFAFVEQARANGITVPIIPGIKSLDSKKQLSILPRRFHLDIPIDLEKEVLSHDDSATKQIGIEWATAQCRELLQRGVPALHFYSMNKCSQIKEILKRII